MIVFGKNKPKTPEKAAFDWTRTARNYIYDGIKRIKIKAGEDMPTMTFVYPDGTRREVDAPEGLSVMEIAQKHDIEEIEGACGGSLACATCHVYIHPDWWGKCLPEGERSEDEEDMLDLAFDVRDRSRLGCQIVMSEDLDGLVVALPGTDSKKLEKAA